MRSLEARLQRIEQGQQRRRANAAQGEPPFWERFGIDTPAAVRMALSVDVAQDKEPPPDCSEPERACWFYLRDVLHFDKLPF